MFVRFTDFVKKVIGIFTGNETRQAFGVNVCISPEMKTAIDLWCKMYEGSPPWCSEAVKSMKIPSAVASELARLATIEMRSEISGSGRARYLNEQYQKVVCNIRRYTEYGCAKGGLIFKPYVTGGNIAVDCVQADRFYPTAFDSSGHITGAVFSDSVHRGDRIYTRLEYHDFLGGQYTVKNAAYVSNSENHIGVRTSLSDIAEWAELQEETTIQNIDRPLFAYFKMPQANTTDITSALGAAAYAGAEELIMEADKQYSRLLWEFESGERALYVSDTAFRKDKDGKAIFPHKRLYRLLQTEGANEDLFQDWSPTLREENILRGLNAILRKVEFRCGLAYGTLSDVQETDKTAEEIKLSKQRSYSTVCDIQKALKTALSDLIYAMDVLCSLYHLAPNGTYTVSFEFDDSIVADRKTEFSEKQMLVTAGIMRPWEFRMWYFGESEEEAKAAVGDTLDVLSVPNA